MLQELVLLLQLVQTIHEGIDGHKHLVRFWRVDRQVYRCGGGQVVKSAITGRVCPATIILSGQRQLS